MAKFRRKKTTDDCMTPPAVYDVALCRIRTHCREELRGFTPDTAARVAELRRRPDPEQADASR